MATKELFLDTLGSILKIPPADIDTTKDYFSMGGNSINAARLVVTLRKKGVKLALSDFLDAKSLDDLFAKVKVNDPLKKFSKIYDEDEKFALVDLGECPDHKEAIDFLTKSFFERDALVICCKTTYERLRKAFELMWDYTIKVNYSIGVVEKSTGKIVAANLNYDYAVYDKDFDWVAAWPEEVLPIFAAVEVLEEELKDATIRAKDGAWFYSFIFGTKDALDHRENLAVTHLVSRSTEKFAKAKNCVGLTVIDTSPVTGALDDEYGYTALGSFQLNTFDLEGRKPFAECEDFHEMKFFYKFIE
ncbi:unnamed protein product [Owenia fusiformis]|uniref:Uncharacterized protein n=1 Tax=Owenia fusiformis TaxID=6347 RepID=A0A8J1XJY2_OWEFU|nr:unnamed protein product [Owenia fusiformis]